MTMDDGIQLPKKPVSRGETDVRYIPRGSHEDQIRLGRAKYLANEEVLPKAKNFREDLARKGRPSAEDVVYANENSKHFPHLFLGKSGIISLATGKNAGLGIQFDPEKGELTMSGHQLNLNFNKIDLRALDIDIIAQHVVNLLVRDGSFYARVNGEVAIESQVFRLRASKWMRVDSPDIRITTEVVSSKEGLASLDGLTNVVGLKKKRGSLSVLTDHLIFSAAEDTTFNSPDIKWGHDGILNPYGVGPLPPVRPNARMYDSTKHFCPYQGGIVKGWIDGGSENVKST